MALLTIPVFSFPVNWSGDLTETLEWSTSILTSQTGAEQRRQLRQWPRRFFECSFTHFDLERSRFDQGMAKVGTDAWYVPIWHRPFIVTEATSVGQNYLKTTRFDSSLTDGRENQDFLTVGSAIAFIRDDGSYDLHEITGVRSGGGFTVTPNVSSWSVGQRGYLVRSAQITERKTLTKRTARIADARLRFRFQNPLRSLPTNYVGDATIYDPWIFFQGQRVITYPPNEADTITSDHDRIVDEFDPGLGRWLVRDLSLNPIFEQEHRWFLKGDAEQQYFINLLGHLRGQLTEIWLPTFYQDIELFQSMTSTASQMRIRPIGYDEFGDVKRDREFIQIALLDGTMLFAQVLGSFGVSGDYETLLLSAPLGRSLAPSEVKRISFVQRMRSAQDSVEILHRGPDSVSTVSMNFRSTARTRVAADYTV